MIPISKPIIARNAKKYLLDCLNSSWISSKGPYVEKFERAFAKFVGTKYAVATSSGTSALHLSLATLNIGADHEVIVPDLTMIAAALPIIYVGAKPVLIDSESDTGNLDPAKIEDKISNKTRAIIVVHLNGHPADLKSILNIAKKHQLAVIEDAAESHGAKYNLAGKWKPVGSIGDLGCFSFYGNKIVTTGEGGMVATNNKRLAERAASLRNLARSPKKHFYHKEVSFVYRMSNLQAALGLAQLEEVETSLKKKAYFASVYFDNLKNLPFLQLPIEKQYAKRIYWNFDVLIKPPVNPQTVAKYLSHHGVESRIFVIPLHKQPAFLRLGLFKNEHYPVADRISKIGLSLPLGPNIKNQDINYICHLIKQVVK